MINIGIVEDSQVDQEKLSKVIAKKIKSKNEDFELTPNQHFIFDKNSKRNTVTNVFYLVMIFLIYYFLIYS